jgi:hypothetical protein
LRPKYLLITKLRENITLSGRRWKPHGSSKEGSGKEAGSKEGSGKEARSKEEITFFSLTLHFFIVLSGCIFQVLVFPGLVRVCGL